MNEFNQRMKELLKEEYEAFEASQAQPMYKGVRLNPHKSCQLESRQSVAWCPIGYYQLEEDSGLDYRHFSGAFYLQEPSAMAPVQALDIQPDDLVLDCCAAPGGKSTQIAGYLQTGYLLANEFEKSRVKKLASNIERFGFPNVGIVSMGVDQLAKRYQGVFDKVLVDAPCSGEGMAKKHEIDWSLAQIQACAKRQKEILGWAIDCLKEGGQLVYSTCTYAPEENEEVIAYALEHFPVELVPVSIGRPGLLAGTARIFPMDGGEGHFLAKLRKVEGLSHQAKWLANEKEKLPLKHMPSYLHRVEDRVYGMEHPFLAGCEHQGILLGHWVKNRFEPAHALAMSTIDYLGVSVELNVEQADAYCHGQVISLACPKGWVRLCFQGLPLGLGKSDGQQIKNKLPKGLRLMEGSHLKG